MEYLLGYREVIPDQTVLDKPREIILNTGGNQSTLQDIKVPERAGGYSYKNTSKYYTQNRFISWRTSRDILELVECSLDLNLVNNRVRYKFNDTPILGGISVQETSSSVIILVVTVSSVHKLSFPHPDKIHKQDSMVNDSLNIQSIFSDVSMQSIKNSHTFNVIPSTDLTNAPVAYAATSCLVDSQTEALFALAYSTGSILLLHLDITTGLLQSNELKQESIVPRFLSGIATAFRGRMTSVDIPMCLVMHSYCDDVNLFALCREGRIRMWSCSKLQCVSIVDVLSSNYTLDQTIHNYDLKKFSNSKELYLCTYLKFEAECEFCILKVIQELNTFKLMKVSTVKAMNQHLVDFSFTTTRLWAVWRTSELDTVAVTHTLLPLQKHKQINCKWESVILEHPPDKDYIVTDFGIDPQQAYIKYIFHPGRFSIIDITRALNIYQKSFSSSEVILSSSVLKEKVCLAVESEIQTEVLDYELTDEDYLEIVNRCWSKFYSCVLEYHINGARPVGILLLPNVYGTILLKKSSFSILRPMEILEHLILCDSKLHPEQLKNLSIFSQDNSIHQDVITLISALTSLDENLTDDFKASFRKELSQLNSPDIIIEKLLTKFSYELHGLFTDFDFQSEIYHLLENIQDISNAMTTLLEFLTYDLQKQSEPNINNKSSKNSSVLLDFFYFFGSKLGTSVISKTTTQINSLRFTICRNLLILQQIALSRPELFNSFNLHVIKSSLAPKTVVLTQAYYVVMWICESDVVVSSAQSSVEISLQRLSVLKFSDSDLNLKNQRNQSHSLLDLFIQHGVKQYKHEIVDDKMLNISSINCWHFGMLKYATLVSQLIWPISGDFYFPDWLLFSCQFTLVQEYVRLLNPWCEWNGAARKFILAVSFLEMGEPQKAYDNFLKAFNGMLTDNYLSNLLLLPDLVSENIASSHYFLKVIQIFEQHNLPDYIIELAVTAVTIAEKCDPNLPTLHSIVFARHLDLGHHIEAYNCLNINPDTDRRIDCLRQLVVTLFDRKKLLDLVSFPYIDMYQDLEKIVEDRARSVDVMTSNYYNFLYSFHMNKGNARKAASIMYEQAVRLSEEPSNPIIFSRQTSCLLACMNALSLVNEKHRWIVRPIVDVVNSDNQDQNPDVLLKPEEILQYKVKKQVTVLELSDIKKEYLLAKAKYKLLKHNSDLFITVQTSPVEIVLVMSRVGLFQDALDVCESFKLCKSSVFENLTSECANFNTKSTGISQNWIYFNDISDTYTLNLSASDISWKLLKDLLMSHEKKDESTLHKVVARKLFQLDMFIPQWLCISYSKRNPTEFFRLMITMGRLEEAAYFAVDYFEAILSGKNKENFGLESILLATKPPVCSPFNILIFLLAALKEASQENSMYVEIYELVLKTTENYSAAVKRVSADMLTYKISQNRIN